MSGSSDPIELAAALAALRVELEQAWVDSQAHRVRFRVSEVTLELEAVTRRDRKLGGKVRWWVVEGGADSSTSGEATQTLTLTLQPSLHEGSGSPQPLDVHGKQPAPGQ